MPVKSDFTLSSAKASDRESLLQLHRTARYETEFPLVPEYAQATLDSGYYEKLWRNNFPSSDNSYQVIKAEIGNRIVGFCRFGVLDYEEYPNEKLGELRNGLGELHQLYVHEDYRGTHGIGTALYCSAIASMKQAGYRHMLVSMIDANTAARSFYEKIGAVHAYSYLDNLKRGDKVIRKMVAVYIHKNIKGRLPFPS